MNRRIQFLNYLFKNFLSSLALAAPKPSDGKKKQHVPMAIIIEPARELAQQTFENIKLFKKYLPAPKLKYIVTQEYTQKNAFPCCLPLGQGATGDGWR